MTAENVQFSITIESDTVAEPVEMGMAKRVCEYLGWVVPEQIDVNNFMVNIPDAAWELMMNQGYLTVKIDIEDYDYDNRDGHTATFVLEAEMP